MLDGGSVELEDGTEAYELRKMNLFEVSLVQIPANQRAVVTGVKEAPSENVVELKEALSGETVATIGMNIAEPEEKSGRRNSKADADELRRIREMAYSIATTVDGLLADEQDSADTDEVKAEEPNAANAEEPKEDVLAQLKDVAEQLLNS